MSVPKHDDELLTALADVCAVIAAKPEPRMTKGELIANVIRPNGSLDLKVVRKYEAQHGEGSVKRVVRAFMKRRKKPGPMPKGFESWTRPKMKKLTAQQMATFKRLAMASLGAATQ